LVFQHRSGWIAIHEEWSVNKQVRRLLWEVSTALHWRKTIDCSWNQRSCWVASDSNVSSQRLPWHRKLARVPRTKRRTGELLTKKVKRVVLLVLLVEFSCCRMNVDPVARWLCGGPRGTITTSIRHNIALYYKLNEECRRCVIFRLVEEV
jgi:hypothetical protein